MNFYSPISNYKIIDRTQILNALVALLLGGHGHNHHHDIPKKTKKSTRESVNKALSEGVNGPPCCSPDPVKQLNDIQRMASVLENEDEDAAKDGNEQQEDVPVEIEPEVEKKKIAETIPDAENIPTAEFVDSESLENVDDEAQRLHKMGLNTAIAIGLHNFPEGTYE